MEKSLGKTETHKNKLLPQKINWNSCLSLIATTLDRGDLQDKLAKHQNATNVLDSNLEKLKEDSHQKLKEHHVLVFMEVNQQIRDWGSGPRV